MRKLTAHFIFDGYQWHRNKIITVNDEGIITGFEEVTLANKEASGTEFYNGILCPGFVNAHVHLELSFLKDKFHKIHSLSDFIAHMRQIDRTTSTDKEHFARLYDQVMYKEGISVCGDISNTPLTSLIKKQSNIYYYTFCELYSVDEDKANITFNEGRKLCNMYYPSSITPHAPYSVSFPLMKSIINSITPDSIISIHFKESKHETNLFLTYQRNFPVKNNPSLDFINYLPKSNHCLFVHNTFINEEDIRYIIHHFEKPYFVLCPNSNIFIEKTLPPYFLIKNLSDNICIGTDSLASNRHLSIVEEIKTLSFNYSDITLDKWLQMATSNGAKALKVDHIYGKIDIGTKPGIVLIENVDLHRMSLTKESFSKRIV